MVGLDCRSVCGSMERVRKGVLVRETRCAHQKQRAGVPATVRTGRCAHQRGRQVQSAECGVQNAECRVQNAESGRRRVQIKTRSVSEGEAASAWCLMASESCIARPSAFHVPLSDFRFPLSAFRFHTHRSTPILPGSVEIVNSRKHFIMRYFRLCRPNRRAGGDSEILTRVRQGRGPVTMAAVSRPAFAKRGRKPGCL